LTKASSCDRLEAYLFGEIMNRTRDWIWDIETYKHAFTFSIIRADGKFKKTFEVSARINEVDRILNCLDYLHDNEHRLVGFNSCGFDYPIVHKLIENRNALPKTGKALAAKVFQWAQKQIDSFKNDGFGYTVKTADQYVKQVDLYRIWHFNNKAKATGLKMLEFNMRLDNIEDLPYDIEEELTDQMLDDIKAYNEHDVACTLEFYNASESQIDFRDNLSIKLDRDFTNADDTKIGAEYFQMELEKAGVSLYTHKDGKRVIKQTKRDKIAIKDCLFNYYSFQQPEFQAIYDWFSKQVITETKGVFSDIEEHDLGDVAKYAELEIKRKKFKAKPTEAEVKIFLKEHPLGWIEEEQLKATEYLFDAEGNHVMEYPLDADGSPDFTKKQKKARIPKKSYWGCYRIAATLNVLVNGFRLDFGVGGIHGSLSNKIVKSTKSWNLIDYDVSSYYPNLAISNRIYPEHLTEKFCDIYKDMYDQRKSYPKASAENAMLKLALNGTYGKSNDKYSVFYDPKFTMSITIGGQLTLCLLIDMFYQNDIRFKMVMANTDGITFCCKCEDDEKLVSVVKEWEQLTKLQMERVDYSKMIIRDVNNYISVYKE
jgi:DNA polymerase elongation subunit (family B)